MASCPNSALELTSWLELEITKGATHARLTYGIPVLTNEVSSYPASVQPVVRKHRAQ
jgi:hypothetical protein